MSNCGKQELWISDVAGPYNNALYGISSFSGLSATQLPLPSTPDEKVSKSNQYSMGREMHTKGMDLEEGEERDKAGERELGQNRRSFMQCRHLVFVAVIGLATLIVVCLTVFFQYNSLTGGQPPKPAVPVKKFDTKLATVVTYSGSLHFEGMVFTESLTNQQSQTYIALENTFCEHFIMVMEEENVAHSQKCFVERMREGSVIIDFILELTRWETAAKYVGKTVRAVMENAARDGLISASKNGHNFFKLYKMAEDDVKLTYISTKEIAYDPNAQRLSNSQNEAKVKDDGKNDDEELTWHPKLTAVRPDTDVAAPPAMFPQGQLERSPEGAEDSGSSESSREESSEEKSKEKNIENLL